MSGTATTTQLTNLQAGLILDAVASALKIVRTSPLRAEPGNPLTASLVPASPFIDASELANGVLNIAWTAKDLIFKDAAAITVPTSGNLDGDVVAAGANVLGGQPLPPALGIVGGSITPTTKNVPGLLGQVFGTLAIPRLKVRLEISWILRKNGKVLSESKDFIALDGLASPNVSLLVPPVFYELRLDTLRNPRLELACLSAQVKLTLGPVQQVYDLPPIPILLLPLLIPTVAAMFSEPNFGVAHQGFALLVVPQHSALSSAEQLFSVLNKIQDVIDKLSGIAEFAGWVLGLSDLTDILSGQPRLRFIAADQISDFKDVTVRARRLFELSDTTFDDQARSILLVGLSGTTANFYNDTDFQAQRTLTSEGSYSLTVPRDSLWVMVRDLNQADPNQVPPTFPPGWSRLFRPDTDVGASWAGTLSSFQFSQNWLRQAALESHVEVLEPVLDCALVQIIGVSRLRELTMKELRTKARARGIQGISGMTRAQLEQALRRSAQPLSLVRKA